MLAGAAQHLLCLRGRGAPGEPAGNMASHGEAHAIVVQRRLQALGGASHEPPRARRPQQVTHKCGCYAAHDTVSHSTCWGCNSLAVRSLSSQQYAALAEANANDVALYEATVFLLNQRKAACDAAA